LNTIDPTQPRAQDWMTHSRVTGLVALVAGAGSGIGEAAARTFAANGGTVVVCDLREDAAHGVAAAIVEQGGKAIGVTMDVAKQSDIDAALDQALAKFGKLDVLINTAGVIQPAPLETCSLDDWRMSFRVNVEGALLLARSCLPHLRKSPAAAIVNCSSLAGGRAYPNGGPYGPSKAALIALSRTMAIEWAEDGVRVNCVNPGMVETPMVRANVRPEMIRLREERIPLRRVGQPGELADLIVFLASPAASFITAQDINCDGGMSQALMVQKFNPPG
jgi:NAD(P)-dependent dehydrogenase (short-subunit alcohol dehydrogenase family)